MAAPGIHDIFDLNLIYNQKYTYSLPRNVLEDYLSGKGFDNLEGYSTEELGRLKEDISEIF